MSLRFRKTIKIAPGIKLNIGKKSVSASFGMKGAHHTISSTGKKTNSVSIPGTGISWRKTTSTSIKKKRPTTPASEGITPPKKKTSFFLWLIPILIVVIIAFIL